MVAPFQLEDLPKSISHPGRVPHFAPISCGLVGVGELHAAFLTVLPTNSVPTHGDETNNIPG